MNCKGAMVLPSRKRETLFLPLPSMKGARWEDCSAQRQGEVGNSGPQQLEIKALVQASWHGSLMPHACHVPHDPSVQAWHPMEVAFCLGAEYRWGGGHLYESICGSSRGFLMLLTSWLFDNPASWTPPPPLSNPYPPFPPTL